VAWHDSQHDSIGSGSNYDAAQKKMIKIQSLCFRSRNSEVNETFRRKNGDVEPDMRYNCSRYLIIYLVKNGAESIASLEIEVRPEIYLWAESTDPRSSLKENGPCHNTVDYKLAPRLQHFAWQH
jgi:hypothetical protein